MTDEIDKEQDRMLNAEKWHQVEIRTTCKNGLIKISDIQVYKQNSIKDDREESASISSNGECMTITKNTIFDRFETPYKESLIKEVMNNSFDL